MHFGPRLLAFAAFQKMICGVSYDKIRLGFEQCWVSPWRLHIVSCHAASCPACQAHPKGAAGQPRRLRRETGWKQGGRRVWLWVFTNLRETVYEILPGRGFEQAASVLGKNYAGTLGVDGWAPYRFKSDATDLCCTVATSWRRPTWSRPSSGRPRLARSARCWRDQPPWPARCQGTPPGEDGNPERFAKHLAIGPLCS